VAARPAEGERVRRLGLQPAPPGRGADRNVLLVRSVQLAKHILSMPVFPTRGRDAISLMVPTNHPTNTPCEPCALLEITCRVKTSTMLVQLIVRQALNNRTYAVALTIYF